MTIMNRIHYKKTVMKIKSYKALLKITIRINRKIVWRYNFVVLANITLKKHVSEKRKVFSHLTVISKWLSERAKK